MEKIVVATDFSANSKSGIRFAIQLAQLRNAELIFLHVYQVLRASFWSDQQYQHNIDHHRQVLMKEFPAFINSVYKSMSITPPRKPLLVVHHKLDTVEGIIEYAGKVQASFICISTRGAGMVRKLFGTTASRLIRTSHIPVLCIPSSYRLKPVSHVLYASDMDNYESELKMVAGFAKPLKASIEMLHLFHPYEFLLDERQFKKNLAKKTGYPVELHYKPRDIEQSLIQEIRDAIRKSKPSVVVMFTHQNRSLLERLLLPGSANEYSFQAAVPLLSFPKTKHMNTISPPSRSGTAKKSKPFIHEHK